MRAIQITEPGRFRIVDTPEPAAGPGEVLIAVRACVTCPHWDTTIFRGVDIFERPGHPKYPIPVGYPGHEVSGRVEAVGEGVTSLQVGDRVATLKAGGESNPGFYSELISRPAEMVTRIPGQHLVRGGGFDGDGLPHVALRAGARRRCRQAGGHRRPGAGRHHRDADGPGRGGGRRGGDRPGAGAAGAGAIRWARTKWSASSRARRPRSWNGSRCRPASTAPEPRRACRWRSTTPSTVRCLRSG